METSPRQITLGDLEGVLGRPPDPLRDGPALLALQNPATPTVGELVRRLRTVSRLFGTPLRDLLPGLDLVGPASFGSGLSTRAENCLRRALVTSWPALAALRPCEIDAIPNAGAKTIEEVVLYALREWASAYLGSTEELPATTAFSKSSIGQVDRRESKAVEELIGRTPDPEVDRQVLLALRDVESPELHRLASQFHTRTDWRGLPLQTLLPGLGAMEASPFSYSLSLRAASRLGRMEVDSFQALAAAAPAEIHAETGVGSKTIEEILVVAIRHWALIYLGSTWDISQTDARTGSRSIVSESEALRSSLIMICAWATEVHGSSGALEAIASVTEERHLPDQVERAVRELARFDGPLSQRGRPTLIRAFEEVEQIPGFDPFRRRQLDGERITLAELGAEQGASRGRMHQIEKAVKKALAKRMKDRSWPLRIAAEEIRSRLGAVAKPDELPAAFRAIDPVGSAFPQDPPHRIALVLYLGDYHLSGEWILGPDIASLTDIVLRAVAEDNGPDLDRAARQLSLLGVREEMQLPWVMSRYGLADIASDGAVV